MRSAHWFGFTNIILSTNSADYTNPKTVRASMGSLFHLTIVSDVDLIAALPQIKKTHYLVGSDVREGLPPHPLPQKVALLLGSESHGLPEQLLELADERWCIPGNARADSLSLPQAATIMMYECAKSNPRKNPDLSLRSRPSQRYGALAKLLYVALRVACLKK